MGSTSYNNRPTGREYVRKLRRYHIQTKEAVQYCEDNGVELSYNTISNAITHPQNIRLDTELKMLPVLDGIIEQRRRLLDLLGSKKKVSDLR